MRKKFFIKSLISSFSSMMLPLFLFALIMMLVTNNYVRTEINTANQNILNQSKETSQLIFGSFNAVNLAVSSDQRIVSTLYRIFDESMNYDHNDLTKVSDLTNMINSFTANSPYIDSVYIYLNNNNKKFYSSKHGISTIEGFIDNSWFSYLNLTNDMDSITAERLVKRYDFEKNSKEILSVYRKLFAKDGVVVMNIDAAKLRQALSKFVLQKQQSIILADKIGNFNLHTEADYLTDPYLSEVINDPRDSFIYTQGKVDYVISKFDLNQNGWVFISAMPQKNLYTLQNKLLFIMILVVAACFIIGLIVSFRVVKRNYENISAILYAIEVAESGQAYEELPSRSDEYNYIIRNIVQNGILKQYMQVQLSEKKYMMKNFELTALQCQINPHFLLNTLKTIYWKSVSSEGMEGELPKMIENLSDVVGYSLTNPMTLVKMEKEILHTQSFVEILECRHEGQMTVIWDYPEEVKKIYTEKLILQPLIENAYYHGLRHRKTPGKIKIKIHQEETDLVIRVIDNGVGMSRERLQQVRENMATVENISMEHIGLANTHKRIHLTFGEPYGIKLLSKENRGTVVTLRLPLDHTIANPSRGA